MSETTRWLSVKDFAKVQRKQPVTIYQWVNSGFILEIGFRVVRDVTGHVFIGVNPEHPSYAEFQR